MDLYCVLNASEGQLDIILADTQAKDSLLVAQSWQAPTRGAEILTPALQSLLHIQKLNPSHITHFACVHGPGSFTGIRLIMGTVAAIRRITGASNASIDYMQALALTAQHSLEESGALATSLTEQTCIAVFTHARRNLVHAQFFQLGHALPYPLGPAQLLSPEDACTHMQDLRAAGKHIYMLGSGLKRNAAIFDAHAADIFALPYVHPSAKALYELSLAASYTNQDLEPLYIRPCDAVENLNSIAQKQGMDSAKAHETLASLLKKDTVSDI